MVDLTTIGNQVHFKREIDNLYSLQSLTSRGNALLPYANVVRDGSIRGGYFADIVVPAIFLVHKTDKLPNKTYGFSLI